MSVLRMRWNRMEVNSNQNGLVTNILKKYPRIGDIQRVQMIFVTHIKI